jgi:hypothetical protein
VVEPVDDLHPGLVGQPPMGEVGSSVEGTLTPTRPLSGRHRGMDTHGLSAVRPLGRIAADSAVRSSWIHYALFL